MVLSLHSPYVFVTLCLGTGPSFLYFITFCHVDVHDSVRTRPIKQTNKHILSSVTSEKTTVFLRKSEDDSKRLHGSRSILMLFSWTGCEYTILLERNLILISAGLGAILTEIYLGFPQYCQMNPGIVH